MCFVDEVETVGGSLIARRKIRAGQIESRQINGARATTWDGGWEYLGLVLESLDRWFVGVLAARVGI